MNRSKITLLLGILPLADVPPGHHGCDKCSEAQAHAPPVPCGPSSQFCAEIYISNACGGKAGIRLLEVEVESGHHSDQQCSGEHGTFEKLRTYPIVVAVPQEHPFGRRREVTVADVLGERIVAYSRKEYPDYYHFLARILGSTHKKLHIAEECDSGMSLIAAVESGKGVSLVSSILTETAGRRLRFIPVKPAPPPAVVGVAYRADGLTPLVRKFLDTALSVAATRSS